MSSPQPCAAAVAPGVTCGMKEIDNKKMNTNTEQWEPRSHCSYINNIILWNN